LEKNSKVTDFLYKAFRVILWTIFSLLLLVVLVALAIQVTSVQNWLVGGVTSYLNDNTTFKTEIGKIRITWWDALELENVKIRDHRDSMMISADFLHADFALLSLLPPGDPEVEVVRLETAKINLLTHAGDSIMNINQWIEQLSELFGSGKESSSPFKLQIGLLELRNSEFSVINLNYEPVEVSFDYNRMLFKEINGNAEDFSLQGSDIALDLKFLTGIEQHSGLLIQEFRTNFKFNSKFIELDNLNLRSDKSQIKNFLRMDYSSREDLTDFINRVKITARMEETKISLQDLKLFAPTLPDINDQLYLSGEVIGTVSDLKSEEFLIRIGEKTALFGSFQFDGLPDLEKTYINLSLKNSIIVAKDLNPYLPADLQRQLSKFNTIRLDADFAGLLNRFNTYGKFRTSIGDVEGRVNFDLVNGIPSIVSRITVKNLDLGIIIEDRKLLQKVSLSGNVNFKGNTVENLLVDLNAQISEFGLLEYPYTNIRTDATYGLNLFRGNFSIDDPNLEMTAKGYLNLADNIDSVRLLVHVDTAFLDRINLLETPVFLSGNLDIDTKGIQIDDIEGIARFRDIKVGYEDRFLDVGNFFFQSIFAGGTRTMSLNSDYLVAAASGQFQLEQMFSDLSILARQYLAILINEDQPMADLEKNFSEPYSLDLNVRMNNINPIIQLLQPKLSISKNTILEGAFYQTPENTVFNFFTSIDTVIYQGNTAYKTNIDFNTSKIINSEDILASFYVYSKAQEVGSSLKFNNLGMEAIWDQDNLDLQFSLDQDSTQSKARINAEMKFSAANTQLKFKPSLLQVLSQEWEFDPENLVTIIPNDITFSNLRVVNSGQEIALEGKISSDPNEELQLLINQVDISLLNTVTAQNFEGKADGRVNISGLFGQPLINGDLKINEVEINDFPIGDISANAILSESELYLNVKNFFNGKNTIDLTGTVGLEYQNLEFETLLADANLVIFEPFLSNYITNLGGTVNGNLQVRGTVSSPELIGSGRVNQGRLRVNFLNTSYLINGSILFRPTQISFRDLILSDVNGNRATFTGGVNHNRFSDVFLDITSNLTNFQVLNTTSRDNETFYGTAFATGTIDIKGSTKNLDITARATTQPNTRIFIPLTSSNDQYQEDFIQIINIQDTVRIKQIAEDVNRLDIENIRMNFIMDITPDAYAEIIIDPKTQESIQGRGRGLLTMNIDTQGNFSLTGNYEITEGRYNFSLYNVVKKQFVVQPGGRITWFGDPYQGVMNLKAEYVENVSLQPLIANTSAQENTQMRRRYPVKVLMDLQGELLSPDIKFGFDFSEFPSSGEVQTTISAFQSKLAADDQEMNRQVFSVIMTRNFSPEGQFSGVSNISSSLGNLLSSQLNSFIGQVDRNLEVNIDLASLDQNTLENFQLSVAYTFLDGRLRVSRDGGFTDNQGNADAASIIGDWQAEYMITEDGVYRLRIFNRNNFNTFTSLSISKNVLTYGVSLTQNVSFNSFSELFNKITRSKSSRYRINDSDDFLRDEYNGDETWIPIELDKLPMLPSSSEKNQTIQIVPWREDL
jgi:autotransporter translocation and assembly factor TamB